ncbi:MAG: nicotinate-nucleotide adenylyltransferase [bacterium]
MSLREGRSKKIFLPDKGELRKIGIFGGTFDPIHLGHLICAEQICEFLDLDIVVFIPCAIPPHKPKYHPAEARHRLAMIDLAIRGSENFTVSDIEISRGGISYTVDTVLEIRSELGEKVDLWLLLGLDAYLDLPSWKDPDLIINQCGLAVARRPGYCIDPTLHVGKNVKFIDITAVDISSTEIRRRIEEGRSIRFLVPHAVEQYIRTEKPYGFR